MVQDLLMFRSSSVLAEKRSKCRADVAARVRIRLLERKLHSSELLDSSSPDAVGRIGAENERPIERSSHHESTAIGAGLAIHSSIGDCCSDRPERLLSWPNRSEVTVYARCSDDFLVNFSHEPAILPYVPNTLLPSYNCNLPT